MIAKTLLLVLLGTALVQGSPIQTHRDSVSDQNGRIEKGVSDSRGNSYIKEVEEEEEITALELRDEVRARSIQESWSKLKESWNEVVEVGKIKWAEIKEKSKITFDKVKKHVKVMKEAGLKLLVEAQKTYEVFQREGKCIYFEVRELYDTVKRAYEELRQTSREAFKEYAELMEKLEKVVVVVEVIMKAKNAVG